MASSSSNKAKFTIRVTIHKKTARVLFAEVCSDFANTLISFLTLPLGTIVRLLENKFKNEAPVVGSLNALYTSLRNLDSSHFWTDRGKLMLLNPKNSFENHLQNLKMNVDDTELTKYYACASTDCKNVRMYYNAICECGKQNTDVSLKCEGGEKIVPGVFTTESSSFIISDDLQLLPNFVGTGLKILKELGIEETSFLEEKTHAIGFHEIMCLLKLSFVSDTPLTDLLFHNKPQIIIPDICKPGIREVMNAANTSKPAIMNIKVVVQKSTGEVILVQTRENFVDFLFSLLSIPLGRTLSLLDSDFTLGCISNLYKSLQSLDGDVHGLKIDNTFNKAQLPPLYLSKHQLLPLTERDPTPSFCSVKYENGQMKKFLLTSLFTSGSVGVSSVDPKGCNKSYIKGPTTFTVTDDLRVRPSSDASGLSILSSLKIPLSDVEEHNVDIGKDEALNILKAILHSNSILSDCLNPMSKKQVKKEET